MNSVKLPDGWRIRKTEQDYRVSFVTYRYVNSRPHWCSLKPVWHWTVFERRGGRFLMSSTVAQMGEEMVQRIHDEVRAEKFAMLADMESKTS